LHADRDRLARVEQTLEAQRERIQQQHLQLEESMIALQDCEIGNFLRANPVAHEKA